jgi:hypothetical protein
MPTKDKIASGKFLQDLQAAAQVKLVSQLL